MKVKSLNSRPYIKKNATVLSTDLFYFDKENNTFSQEISTLGVKPEDLESQIFDDACDVGFWLKSKKTADLMLFSFEKSDYNNEELAGWNFKSDEGLKVLIIND
uniref:Uncharacterized protein n=1 Tax=viral metagenome TaxID=1070528 RepID=A0A6M3JQA3_9ZZZZ